MTQNFDANSTNVTEVRTNEHTNGRTDERKDENYIPVGINAGGIIIINHTLYRNVSKFQTDRLGRTVQIQLLEEQSDQESSLFAFCLYHLVISLCGKISLFGFENDHNNFVDIPKIQKITESVLPL